MNKLMSLKGIVKVIIFVIMHICKKLIALSTKLKDLKGLVSRSVQDVEKNWILIQYKRIFSL